MTCENCASNCILCVQTKDTCFDCAAGYTLSGTSCVKCGDGILYSAEEECDDANTDPNDGCNGSCNVEDSHTCTSDSPSVCTSRCGNGVKELIGLYDEGCDDGNLVNSDGCSSTCSVEDAFTCSGSNPSTCTHRCGNGVKDTQGTYSGEACDDANTISNDGCSANCLIEDDYTCNGADPDVCIRRCGNSVKDSFGTHTETCDDGNLSNQDGCSSQCTVEDAFTCDGSDPDVCSARCGNSVTDPFGTH